MSENDPIKKTVQIDLEVDTSTTNSGKNPFQILIHLAKAVDAWRIFPRLFISVYIYLLYESITWFMALEKASVEQAGLISIMTAIGSVWFGLYVGSGGNKSNQDE